MLSGPKRELYSAKLGAFWTNCAPYKLIKNSDYQASKTNYMLFFLSNVHCKYDQCTNFWNAIPQLNPGQSIKMRCPFNNGLSTTKFDAYLHRYHRMEQVYTTAILARTLDRYLFSDDEVNVAAAYHQLS